MRASSQIVFGRSPLSAIVLPVIAGTLVCCGAAIQDDFDVPVVLKALDEELIELHVLPRNDEQVARSDQEEDLVMRLMMFSSRGGRRVTSSHSSS
jgi:hypothetical protein